MKECCKNCARYSWCKEIHAPLFSPNKKNWCCALYEREYGSEHEQLSLFESEE